MSCSRLHTEKLLFIDCQTTGMHPSLGQVLEIAWCVASASDSEPEIYSHLVELEGRAYLSKRVQEITGIRSHHMSEAVPANQAREHFLKSVETLLGEDGTAMIHYAQFEKAFLLDFLFGTEKDPNLPFQVLCTHALSKKLLPHVPSRNIRALSGFFGAHFSEVKRAPQHVRATFEIWKGLADEFEKMGLTNLDEIRNWAASTAKQKSDRYQYKIDREKRLKLPDRPGVYRMIAKNGEILYVGKATSLKDRVNSYFRGKRGRDPRKLEMMTQAWDLQVTECGSALEAALLETDEIKRHDPPYNVSLKGARRRLVFYSRDFESISNTQDAAHCLGPFRTMNSLEDLRMLKTWVETGDVGSLFHGLIAEDLFAPGYEIFKAKWNLTEEPKTFRDRLALAIKLSHRATTESETATETETAPASESGSESESESESEADVQDLVITAEEVAGKFERLYVRAGRSYLRAKMLTRLLNSRVRWQENESWRELVICQGHVSPAESASPCPDGALPTEKSRMPWESMDIADYDRMSVLFSELSCRNHEIRFLTFS